MSTQTFDAPVLRVAADVWIPRAEVLRLTNWTERHLRRKVSSGEVISRIRGDVQEYQVASLPEYAQDAFHTSTAIVAAPAQALLPIFALTTPATGYAANAAAPAAGALWSSPERVGLPDPAATKQAEERWTVLRLLVVDYAANPQRFDALQLRDGKQVTSKARMLQYLAEQNGITIRTLQRWERMWKAGGLAALADKPREDKGKSRWFEKKEHEAAKIIVADAYLNAHRSKRSAYESLLRNAHKLGLTEDELPCYEVVRAYLDSPDLPEPLKVLAREGEKALNEQCSPHLTRDYSMPANDIWQSDHMIHDALVRNDLFDGVAENAQMRLRLTAIMDMRTRKIVGYSWTPEGSSRSIATALRMAVERFGPCRLFYCDNGKDYIKVTRGGREHWMRGDERPELLESADWLVKIGIFARLGIDVQHCLKYHPQSKNIERFFRTLHIRLDAESPHYTTGNAYLRPDSTNIAMASHGKLLRMGRGNESGLLTASEFILCATTWIEDDYNARHKHSGQGMNGRSANDVYDELYPVTMRRLPELADLAQMFWQVSRRSLKVANSQIEYLKREWIAADSQSAAQLYLANGQDVLLQYDPNSPDEGVVTDLNGNRIASVKPKVPTPHSPEAQPIIAESMRQRRQLRNATAESIREVRKQAALMGATSAFTDLRQRAALPEAPVDRDDKGVAAATGTDGSNVRHLLGALITQRVNTTPTAAPAAAPEYIEDVVAKARAAMLKQED